MPNLDRAAMETLLGRLEEEGYPFSQYQLHRVNGRCQLLGKGGFSAVYEMADRNTPEDHYAMKVIGLERHITTSDAFQSTTILQRNLSGQSSGILKIIDAREIYVSLGEDGELIGIYGKKEENEESILLQFILMEKLECVLRKDRFKNITLSSEILQEETEILKFAMQIGQAIWIAHHNNVLHRDIKLENIFRDEKEKSYKLGDFGIAKCTEDGDAETIVYTDGYGAPEIEHRLRDSYNVTADIYSFGISLYLLLNGLRFPGSEGYYVNPVQYNPNFIFPAPEKASEEMTRVIRKMCSYRREERYQSMEKVLSALRSLGERAAIPEEEYYDNLADFATETYREEKEKGKENRKENAADPGQEAAKLSREQRKQRQKRVDQDYKSACNRYMILFSILFILLLEGMQTDVAFVTKWQFWVLPMAVFVTAIMQQIRDFHVVFGIATTVFGIYSAYTVGLQIPHFILLSCVIIGVPALTAAGAIGTGAWMLLALTDRLPWPGFFGDYDLSWFVLSISLILADRFMRLRQKWNKAGHFEASAWRFLYDKLPFFMIVSGVLLFLLQYFQVYTIPEPVAKIHLIRTGVIVFFASLSAKWQEEEIEDVHMDE